ncbi:MAG: hypothetical protein ACOYEB_02950 [Enterococcus lemanii]
MLLEKNRNLIRAKNLTLLKNFLFKKGQALKSEMAKETGLSVVTINSLSKQLLEEGVIFDGGEIKPAIGRPATLYHFNYDQKHYLLLSIQETIQHQVRKLIIVGKVVNLAGEVKAEQTLPFADLSLPNLMTKMQTFLNLSTKIDQVGLSFPGKIAEGIVLSSWENQFDQWKIAEAFAKVSPLPLHIQNDAHLLTVGATILYDLAKEETIVGIFYPENSMPGISIYANGHLLEGGRNLAGEAKFLPHLIGTPPAVTKECRMHSLLEIIAIYNVVIAPETFVISAGALDQKSFIHQIEQSPILTRQINVPKFLFVEDFQVALTTGLRWLVMQEDIYRL